MTLVHRQVHDEDLPALRGTHPAAAKELEAIIKRVGRGDLSGGHELDQAGWRAYPTKRHEAAAIVDASDPRNPRVIAAQKLPAMYDRQRLQAEGRAAAAPGAAPGRSLQTNLTQADAPSHRTEHDPGRGR